MQSSHSILPGVETRSVSQQAYEILREHIVSKSFRPGQKLDLSSIEKQLGISRTPLREALARLEAEGLVEVVSRSGTYVTDPTPKEVAESFEVRKVLELYAIGLALERADDSDLDGLQLLVEELGRLSQRDELDSIYPQYLALDHQLHDRLVELAGNQRLSLVHARENVHAQMARIRYRSSERPLTTAQGEHERIMRALRRRDPESAKAEMKAHLERAKRSILSDMRNGSRSTTGS
jgi:DNA-binding GntR family transcriptional regulator